MTTDTPPVAVPEGPRWRCIQGHGEFSRDQLTTIRGQLECPRCWSSGKTVGKLEAIAEREKAERAADWPEDYADDLENKHECKCLCCTRTFFSNHRPYCRLCVGTRFDGKPSDAPRKGEQAGWADTESHKIGQWATNCATNLQNVAIKGAKENPAADPCECIEFGQAVETRVYDLLRVVEQRAEAAEGEIVKLREKLERWKARLIRETKKRLGRAQSHD